MGRGRAKKTLDLLIASATSADIASVTKQPRVDGKTILRTLRRAGFELDYIEGSHHFLYKEGRSGLVCVPVHGTEIVKPKTFASILNQAGMTVNDFVALQRKRRSKKRSSTMATTD